MATDSVSKHDLSSNEFYVWQVPGKQISIHLRLEVVEQLKQELIRVFQAASGAQHYRCAAGTIHLAAPHRCDGRSLRVDIFR